MVAHFNVSRLVAFCQSVEFGYVNNSGLCDSHLVDLLSWGLLRHGTLIVHLKITG